MNSLLKRLSKMRNPHFFLLDTVIFSVTPVLALGIRLDGFSSVTSYFPDLQNATLLFLAIKLSLLYWFGLYRCCWRYASVDELMQIARFTTAATVLQSLLFAKFYYLISLSSFHALPRSLPLLDGLLSFILIGGVRFSLRTLERLRQRGKSGRGDRTLIVGAGCAGISLVQEMQRNPSLGFNPVAFVDDATEKLHLSIRGVPVAGNRYKIPELIRSLKIHRVIIAMPTAPGNVIREIVNVCQTIGTQTSTIPGIHEILSRRARIDSVRDIQIEDLLRREPIQTDIQQVSQLIQGKRILITGAGGSIGSELCRQILRCLPTEIMLLGKGENSLFYIQQELEQVLQTLKNEGEICRLIPRLSIFITDIRSRSRLNFAFEQFRPDVVFHAAAHKHVPLMEINSPEAITSNVMGTNNLLEAALRYNVSHFVMISTDKAVNPTSIMGASKRVAEMLVLNAAKISGRSFVVVRFGNVLGSRGSVVPTFKQQIATGGPITVTHPDICRYFMTIPEAVQLVLQAAVLGKGGEVFMFDMGKPVKIVDLAKDVIRLSGYEVGKDIDIVFTGLRPGEKLFEELFIPGEQYDRTQHEKIIIVRNASSYIAANLTASIQTLCNAAANNDSASICILLKQLVSEYQPDPLKAVTATRSPKQPVALAAPDRPF